MTTRHRILNLDAKKMAVIANGSVDLVVTSPPYPMIEMWDDIFFTQNIQIRENFLNGKYELSFELMHRELDLIWRECFRVLKEGGIACINIGDATRTLENNFRLFSNHSRILNGCIEAGFQNLPNIIWRKQTNAPSKFMGSGMLPAGAYITLEHEFILIFRKGCKRNFGSTGEKIIRQESAYFWEERNIWFSDLWELKGVRQFLHEKASRSRSAAFPYLIPYRLINMFSVMNDVVLDPFLGTGTTTLAAIGSGRNSIGIENDATLNKTIRKTISGSEKVLNDFSDDRVKNHIEFVKSKKAKQVSFNYTNEKYNFPVMTRQEIKLELPLVKKISVDDNEIIADYI